MRRNTWLLAGGVLLGGLLAVLDRGMGSGVTLGALSAPGRWLGEGLRALSLSGFWGNGAAWLIVVTLCALPLALPVWSRRKLGTRGTEDWLTVLAVPVIFALFYVLINPTLLRPAELPAAGELLAGFFPLACLGSLLSILAAWLALKLLRGLDGADTRRMAGAFRVLLIAAALLLVMGAAYGELAGLLARWAGVTAGNQGGPAGALDLTLLVLAVLAILELVPSVLGALALLWGADLARSVGDEVFGQETVALCARTAVGCTIMVQATVLLAVFANLLQLALIPLLRDSAFTVSVPLSSLALSLGLFLLCRCLERGQQLQDDSDSII